MSSPPSDGPPLPVSCCRLFHWISSSSTITVCCFLNRARVLWCFSASSYAQTYIMLFNHWRIWWKILLLVYTKCLLLISYRDRFENTLLELMPTVLIIFLCNKSFACESRNTCNSDETSGLIIKCTLTFLMKCVCWSDNSLHDDDEWTLLFLLSLRLWPFDL